MKGISFSGSGHLLPYFVGVLRGLRVSIPHHILPTLPVAGASGGSLAALALAAEIDTDEVRDRVIAANAILDRRTLKSVWALDATLRASLDILLPSNIAQTLNDRPAPVEIAIAHSTSVLAIKPPFHDKHDVLTAAAASCFLPLFSAPSLTTRFRNLNVYDGGLLDFQPIPSSLRSTPPYTPPYTPSSTPIDDILRISPLPLSPSSPLARRFLPPCNTPPQISPNPSSEPSSSKPMSKPQSLLLRTLLSSLLPLSPSHLESLEQSGYDHTLQYFETLETPNPL